LLKISKPVKVSAVLIAVTGLDSTELVSDFATITGSVSVK
jgi:hypothetical protein